LANLSISLGFRFPVENMAVTWPQALATLNIQMIKKPKIFQVLSTYLLINLPKSQASTHL
jgi:hypothetical protein